MATTHLDGNSIGLLSSDSMVRGHDVTIAAKIRHYFPESSGIGLGFVAAYVEATEIDPSTFYMRDMEDVYLYMKQEEKKKMEEKEKEEEEEEINKETWIDVPDSAPDSEPKYDIWEEWDPAKEVWIKQKIEYGKKCTIV